MTLIALIEVNNVAMLVGDILVSSPWPADIRLPSVGPFRASLTPGPFQYYPSTTCQKVVRISDHLAVAWCGSRIVARSAVRELRTMSAEQRLTWKDVTAYLDKRTAEDASFRDDLCLMGLFNAGDGLHTFARGKSLWETRHEHAQKILFAGSGAGHMQVASSGDTAPLVAELILGALTAGGQKLRDSAPGMVAMMLQGTLLQTELLDRSTLDHCYGGGYEMAYFERDHVQKFSSAVQVYSTYDLDDVDRDDVARPHSPFRFSRVVYEGNTCFVVNVDRLSPDDGDGRLRVFAVPDILDDSGQQSAADARLLDLSQTFAHQEFTCWNLVVLHNNRVVRLVPLCSSKPTGRNGTVYTEHTPDHIRVSCTDDLFRQIAATLREQRPAIVSELAASG